MFTSLSALIAISHYFCISVGNTLNILNTLIHTHAQTLELNQSEHSHSSGSQSQLQKNKGKTSTKAITHLIGFPHIQRQDVHCISKVLYRATHACNVFMHVQTVLALYMPASVHTESILLC